jgi:hypothetical protein
MDPASVQWQAMENFMALGLTYRFTVARLPVEPTVGPVRLRFLFSKPTDKKPEPEIVVAMDLEVRSHNGTKWEYVLYFEGQKYQRVITMDSAAIAGTEFNEKLIDKIFLQKQVVRQRRLWEP